MSITSHYYPPTGIYHSTHTLNTPTQYTPSTQSLNTTSQPTPKPPLSSPLRLPHPSYSFSAVDSLAPQGQGLDTSMTNLDRDRSLLADISTTSRGGGGGGNGGRVLRSRHSVAGECGCSVAEPSRVPSLLQPYLLLALIYLTDLLSA